MDLIYKVNSFELEAGKPYLQQMERNGRPDSLFCLRFVDVSAVSLNAARAIQRQYRESQR